jgi:hypothetical protein
VIGGLVELERYGAAFFDQKNYAKFWGDSMRKIFKLIFSKVFILVAVGFSGICHAEEVTLPCCTDGECPTTFESPGEPDVIQTVTFKGVRIGSFGEVVTMHARAPGYRKWMMTTVRSLPREIRNNVIDAASANPTILVKCSGSTGLSLLEKGKSVTCPVGTGIVLTQDDPTCEDPETGPHSVVDITKVSREQKEREMARLEAEIVRRSLHLQELDAEHVRNQGVIAEHRRKIDDLEDRFFGVSNARDEQAQGGVRQQIADVFLGALSLSGVGSK